MNLEETYDLYGRQLYGHALALTRHAQDAEDVVQSVFLKCAGSKPGARVKDVEAYLHTAVRRESLRHVKRRRRFRPLEGGLLVTSVNGVTRDDAEKLNACLFRLPAKQREVVVLHVYEGMTFQHLGKVLGVSPDTAASRFRYAKEKLRRWLRGLG